MKATEQDIIGELGDLVETEALKVWAHTPNKSLDGKKPVDVDIEKIRQIAYWLNNGLPS